MKMFVRIIRLIAALFGRTKGPKKTRDDVPNDNYPLF